MTISILSRVVQRFNVIRWAPRAWIRQQVDSGDVHLRSFGTTYARGMVADTPELWGSLAVLCGAGEDISFDLQLQKDFDCKLQIVDPTPRAIAHVGDVLEAGAQGLTRKSYTINHVPLHYDLEGVDFSKIQLVQFGVWNETTTLRFFAPRDPAHVSYSITNLQGTTETIEMCVKTLDQIASGPIGLLKLNIEGAEIEVLMWLVESALRPHQILVVFDELHTPNAQSTNRIKAAVEGLRSVGYRMVDYNGFGSCLFVHDAA